jgi:hypothetical protein
MELTDKYYADKLDAIEQEIKAKNAQINALTVKDNRTNGENDLLAELRSQLAEFKIDKEQWSNRLDKAIEQNSVLHLKEGGRSFENTFRMSFIKDLYNEGKGLHIMAEYFNQEMASRKYSNTTEPQLMKECRSRLKSLNWNDGDTSFEEIEMDCVLRCYIDLDKAKEFPEPVKILSPKKPEDQKLQSVFTKKISDSTIVEETEPNNYVIVEISSHSNNLCQKLAQLEKDLLFLLLRHQKHQAEPTATIESIISYAFLVIPHSPLKKGAMDELIHKEIINRMDLFPQLYRLYKLGRFARYYTPAGMKAIITELSAHVAANASSSHESAQSRLIREKSDKLRLLCDELNAAIILSKTNPAIEQDVIRLRTATENLILERNFSFEDV